MRAILQGYAGTKTFNVVAGTLDNIDEASIALQLNLFQEEYLETVQAFDNKDNIELLDGAVDMLIIAFGMIAKLEVAGFDVATAIDRVVANNLSKFTRKGGAVAYNAEYVAKTNEIYNLIVVKNKDGKIMKPSNFVPVVLDDLVPKVWSF
jgi:rhamnose utilization protein RhaD (predicted bifunctional aldolase and dehydrogenase)